MRVAYQPSKEGCRPDTAVITGPGVCQARSDDRVRCQMIGGLAGEFLTIRSNRANSLLAKRCLKTGVRVPPFSEKSARLHFVPPTSSAHESPRSPELPESINDRMLCYGLYTFYRRARAVYRFRGPQLPAGNCGTVAGLGRAPDIEDGR